MPHHRSPHYILDDVAVYGGLFAGCGGSDIDGSSMVPGRIGGKMKIASVVDDDRTMLTTTMMMVGYVVV